jgi:UDP-3-O-[3-hydroxymyristoyl] glucosamine N-acyltransferase
LADLRFFPAPVPQTLARLATLTGAQVPDGADGGQVVLDVAPLQTATASQLSFFDNRKYLEAFQVTQAGVCFVRATEAPLAPVTTVVLVTADPYKAYALAAQAFYPAPVPTGAVHPRAVVSPTARIGEHTDIGAGAVIEDGAEIGSHCRIAANVVIGAGVCIGDHTVIGAGASLSHCLIGSHVVIYPGARLGQPGFGFAFNYDHPVKVPQLGRVIIEDHVEIGANTTVDRGAGPDTVIRQGAMIDNLVQIGHNVTIGRGAILAGQAGISGSTRIGDYTMVGGQAGMTGHISIGRGAKIAAGSGVMRDVADGEAVGGSPAIPLREFFKQMAYLARQVRRGKGS